MCNTIPLLSVPVLDRGIKDTVAEYSLRMTHNANQAKFQTYSIVTYKIRA
ncbi:hypothetical protein [Lentilactobacillus kefiri]